MYESVCKKESAYSECILQDAQNMTEVVWQLGRKQSYRTYHGIIMATLPLAYHTIPYHRHIIPKTYHTMGLPYTTIPYTTRQL